MNDEDEVHTVGACSTVCESTVCLLHVSAYLSMCIYECVCAHACVCCYCYQWAICVLWLREALFGDSVD